ncbi:MAG: 5-formyltetrahydrofolate cyclo-ligase [Candidatus Kapabacteria bacterium]|nr:5-formyltetrahydrofolate cyclo-ligase [Candidatus Kapabacteria bacterium]
MNRKPATSKDELRQIAHQRRGLLSLEERTAASLEICRSMIDLDQFLDARGLHVYLPIGNEVDIRPIINLAWEMGKQVGLMRVMDDGGSEQWQILPSTHYRTTKLGILEPTDAAPFDMEQCDLVIAPLLAADLNCNRLGYGKGYYDQFLTQFPRPAIGVAFDIQIFDQLPTDDRDIRLDSVLTEKRLIQRAENGK